MQPHPHLRGSHALRPRLPQQRSLGIEGRSNPIRGGRERRLDRITDGLEVDAIVRRDGLIEQGEVAVHRGLHGCPIPLPERGASLNIREQEGDGAGWEIGHDRFPHVRTVKTFPDCRT
jgi:hypothetical protein